MLGALFLGRRSCMTAAVIHIWAERAAISKDDAARLGEGWRGTEKTTNIAQ
jgi:hypothetical protein